VDVPQGADLVIQAASVGGPFPLGPSITVRIWVLETPIEKKISVVTANALVTP